MRRLLRRLRGKTPPITVIHRGIMGTETVPATLLPGDTLTFDNAKSGRPMTVVHYHEGGRVVIEARTLPLTDGEPAELRRLADIFEGGT